MARLGDTHLAVAAIDFGTTYSGYAYSFRHEFIKDPLKIYTNQQWLDSESGLLTFKAPTSILFDKDGNFDSFGFLAEENYNTLVEDEKEDGWRFFRRFKMNLYREMNIGASKLAGRLDRDLKLKDEQGRTMSAMDIFSDAIRYLKDHCLEVLGNAVQGMKPDDVHWILTVPAIWTDAAKQFMREAASKAGIKDHQLDLALEPEAAAIYCKEIMVKARVEEKNSRGLSAFIPGEKFLLLDIGGGTVDITCHQVMNDSKLKEIHPPTGGPWGGTVVDEAYFSFLHDLVGQKTWDDFVKSNKSGKLDLERVFEMKKRNLKQSEFTFIKVGQSFLQTCSNKNKKYSSTVEVKKDKLKLVNGLMKEFFQFPMMAIVEHLESLFMKRPLRDITNILMVGGFSESDLMKDKIELSFPGKNVIRPVDANIAVLKGAVIFGHSPEAICERTSPRTYGICVSVPYDVELHPRKSYFVSDGCEMASDIFQVMVKAGQTVRMGKTKAEHVCRPAHAYDTVSTVELYESTNECPEYTSDPSCRQLGELEVEMPDTTKGKDRRIVVAIHFGYTELKFTATEEGTNHKAEAKFNCLR
ncbi:heat shock 70 kDa protein 12B-like [Pecten maximus]|uniref:heat shock 70 kDa protein 12B-like n=1 Tax=Pecten maximus TaxID=6579 RepID=UPI001458EF86|nr:heat shock 70 kDa protein 12B-like [Pecten maximus]